MSAARAIAVAAYLVALAAAVCVLALQPLGDPWWIYADADATYTGSSLNISAGGQSKYFDHPGLPLQEAGAAGFVVWHAFDRITGSAESMHAFAGNMMLNLDRARPLYRGIAVFVYLLGVTAVFLVASRALGHPLWGLAGALMWLASPLVPMSIQFRPDVLLSWLVLVGGFLIVSGYERRDPVRLLGASVLIGFTLMVKMHAVGLIVPLVLAVALAGPFPDWRARTTATVQLRRRPIAAITAVLLAVGAYFCVTRIPFHPYTKGLAILAAGAAVAAAWMALGRLRPRNRLLDGFNGALVGGIVLGVAIPVVIELEDGLRSLTWVAQALLGRGVNAGVTHLTQYSLLTQTPLVESLAVFALAGIAALVGAFHRQWSDLIWFAGALTMAALAFERLGTVHYFAPAYALAIVPALRLARLAGRAAPLAAVALVLAVSVPQLSHLDNRGRADVVAAASVRKALPDLLGPGEVAMTQPFDRLPDTLYFSLLATYVVWAPPYPYRTLPATPKAEWILAAQHLRPRYWLANTIVNGVSVGDYTIRPGSRRRVGDYYAYRLATGPGVDRPVPPDPPPGSPLIAAP